MRPRNQAMVDDIIGHVEPRGHLDLIADFAHPLPVTVICDMFGIPEGDREIFHAGLSTGGRVLDLPPLSPPQSNSRMFSMLELLPALFELRRRQMSMGAARDVVGIRRGAISGNMKVSFQACEVNRLIDGLCGQRPPAIDLAHVDLAGPGAPSTMRNSGGRKPRLMRSSRTVRQASCSAAHALDREQHLLAVLAHAKDDKERDSSRFAVEPHAHHCAVENEPHVRFFGKRAGATRPSRSSPCASSAHRILADRAAKQGSECAAHPACVGAGKVGARDQRVGNKRAPLIGPQRLALPLRRLAIRSVQPGARHLDLHPAEASHQRPRSMAMAVTGDADRLLRFAARRLRMASVARPRQRHVELALDHGMDELANPIAQATFDRIKPVRNR